MKTINKITALVNICIWLVSWSYVCADTITRSATISSGSSSGTCTYKMTESTDRLEFELNEDQVKASVNNISKDAWAEGASSLGLESCSGSANFSTDINGDELASDLFVTNISGTYTPCSGSGSGGSSTTPAFNYNLAGSVPNGLRIEPPSSTVNIDEWLPLTALNYSDSAVSVVWNDNADGTVLYSAEDTGSIYDGSSEIDTVYFRSKDTGDDFKIGATAPYGSSYEDPADADVTVLGKVDLEKVDLGNDHLLEPGVICLNAQPEYKRARWNAIIEDDDDSVNIEIISGDVSFAADAITKKIGVLNYGNSESNEFWVYGVGSGPYEIEITHSKNKTIKSSRTGTVFGFEIKDEGINWSPSTVGSQVVSNDNIVSARNHHQTGEQYARSIGSGHAIIATEPANMYSGNIGVQAKIDADFDGQVELMMGDRSNKWKWSYELKVKIPGFIPGEFKFQTVINENNGDAYESSTAGMRSIVKLDGAESLDTQKYFLNNETSDPANMFQMIVPRRLNPEMDIVLTQDEMNIYKVGEDKINYKIEINAGANGLGADPSKAFGYMNRSSGRANLELKSYTIEAHNNLFNIEE